LFFISLYYLLRSNDCCLVLAPGGDRLPRHASGHYLGHPVSGRSTELGCGVFYELDTRQGGDLRGDRDRSALIPNDNSFMNWTVISATNNEELLKSCLLSSPDVGEASEVILQKGYASAAAAYNQAIDKAQTDLLVFVHQDVYLPQGWLPSLRKSLDLLSKVDPDWGVIGVYGVNESCDGGSGFLYCAETGRIGKFFEGFREVKSLDEVVLIIRKSSHLRFDEQLPGFHLYGTDLCLQARQRQMKSYVVPAFCIHNTSGYRILPLQFWRCYFYLRRKWRSQLPFATSCTRITFWCWPMIYHIISRAAEIALGHHRATSRFADPSRFYLDLVSSGGWLSPSAEPERR
jgi:Glycosyltransferase like family